MKRGKVIQRARRRPFPAGVLVAALGLSLWLPGCRSGAPAELPPPSPQRPEAELALADGLAAYRAGDLRAAQSRFRSAIVLDGALVRAHVHYQETWIRRARRGTALAEYEKRLAANPTGLNRYLWGRLLEDPDQRLAAFDAAVSQQSGIAWAHLERAMLRESRGDSAAAATDMSRAAQLAPRDPTVLLNRGFWFLRRNQPHLAMNCFSQVTRLDPENDRAHFGLYRTHARHDAVQNAMRSLKECLFLRPTEARYLGELRRYATRHASFRDLKELEELLQTARAEHPDSSEVRHTLGWIRDRVGRPYSSIRCLRQAGRGNGMTVEAQRELIRVLVRMGQYREAFEAFQRYVPAATLFAPENRLRPRWEALRDATLRVGANPGAEELGHLARAYARAGWVANALQVYDRLRAFGSVDPSIEAEAVGCLHFLGFLRVVDGYFESRYKAFKRDHRPGSLNEVLADLSRLAHVHGGAAASGPLPVASYAFIGSVLDRAKSRTHPIVRMLDRYNHYLLIGQRVGGPPEAVVCARLDEREPETRSRLGRSVPHRYILGCNLKVRSFRESLDQHIGGVTIGHEYYLNLDFIHRWRHTVVEVHDAFASPAGREDLFHDEAPSAADRGEALDLSSPLATRKRLFFLFCESWGGRAPDVETFVEMVRAHEEGHVLDAARYLPVMNNLWRILSLAGGNGFSAMGVEGYLEGNAEITALAEGPAPKLSLAQLIGFLPSAGSAPPHSYGYHDAVERIVRVVYDDAERFPEIDRHRNILQQLPLLNDAKLRALGRQLAEERGLTVD